MPLSEDIWGEIFSKRPTTIKLDLSRMGEATAILGVLPSATPCVLIGGTNGKGSTSGMLWRLLGALGKRVGLFTSPHLRHFRERIQITHDTITDDLLWGHFEQLKADLPRHLYDELTFFEVTTLLALRVFQGADTEINIFEVGLGGRLDATNILDPVASAVVSIGYDHQEFLGPTLKGIAFEKLGIARPNRPFVWGIARGYQPEVDEAYDEALKRVGFLPISTNTTTHLIPADLSMQGVLSSTLQGNFKIAATLLNILEGPESTQSAIRGFLDTRLVWPSSLRCRTEFFQIPGANHQRILLDVCHNIDSVKAFAKFMQDQHLGRIPGAVAILRDKDFNAMLDELRLVLNPMALFCVDHERSWTADLLAERHRDLPFFKTLEALFKLDSFCKSSLIAGCGSFYAVNHLCEYLDLPSDQPLYHANSG